MAEHPLITAPLVMAGVSMLVGTSSGIAMRYGSDMKRGIWKNVLGRRKYEIIFAKEQELETHQDSIAN